MIEFLIHDLLWWHWIIFGIILIVSEIIVPHFVVIWFGMSALVVGIVDKILHTSFSTELALWTLLSVALLVIWLKFFKTKPLTESGQADYRFDTRGIVISPIKTGKKGKVRFDAPVLGSSEWHAISDEALENGTPVRIQDVNGQLIKVTKED